MKKTNGWQNPRLGLKDFFRIVDKAKEGKKKETIPLYIYRMKLLFFSFL